MTQKTLSDILHQQTRNAMEWLNQKVPGTENYTPSDFARDVFIASIKPTSKNKKNDLYLDDTFNGYYADGPEGPGMYIDGKKID